ncbi:hypothetical protein ACLMMR_41815, partial [Streptomyces sp. NPDC000405]
KKLVKRCCGHDDVPADLRSKVMGRIELIRAGAPGRSVWMYLDGRLGIALERGHRHDVTRDEGDVVRLLDRGMLRYGRRIRGSPWRGGGCRHAQYRQ